MQNQAQEEGEEKMYIRAGCFLLLFYSDSDLFGCDLVLEFWV